MDQYALTHSEETNTDQGTNNKLNINRKRARDNLARQTLEKSQSTGR
jgi:hypothetical protein